MSERRNAKSTCPLVALIDWYSRRALSWRISNGMEAVFCVDCLEQALRIHGKPDMFNTGQGSQFTSDAFIEKPEIPNAKNRGSAVQLWVQSRAT